MESSQTGAGVSTGGGTFTAGVGEQWAGVALPLVRKVFGQIAAKEFVSVQPMNLPSGLVFFLDFQYGTTKNPFTAAAGAGFYGTRHEAEQARTFELLKDTSTIRPHYHVFELEVPNPAYQE